MVPVRQIFIYFCQARNPKMMRPRKGPKLLWGLESSRVVNPSATLKPTMPSSKITIRKIGNEKMRLSIFATYLTLGQKSATKFLCSRKFHIILQLLYRKGSLSENLQSKHLRYDRYPVCILCDSDLCGWVLNWWRSASTRSYLKARFDWLVPARVYFLCFLSRHAWLTGPRKVRIPKPQHVDLMVVW